MTKSITPLKLREIIDEIPEELKELDLMALRNGERFTLSYDIKQSLFGYFDRVYDTVKGLDLIKNVPIHKEIINNKTLRLAFGKTMGKYKSNEKVSLERLTEDTLAQYGFVHGVPSYSPKYASRRMSFEF